MSGNSPEISREVALVIVNFFTATYLEKCLQAVTAQTLLPNVILIVNNGDYPHALDFVGTAYPFARVIESGNIGFAAANNLACKQLESYRWMALLNPDAFPEPDWLEQLVEGAKRNRAAACFASQLVQAAHSDLLDGQGDCYHFSGLAWRRRHGRKRNSGERDMEVFSACAAAALYSRSAFVDAGGFDEAYFCYLEDVDLGFRMRLRGYRCMYIPGAVVNHVGGAASGASGRSDFALYYGHRNLVWTYLKNVPGYLFWLLLPAHLLLNLVEVVWFALSGRGRVICAAKLHALQQLPRVLRERKYVQSRRKIAASSILRVVSFWPFSLDR